MSQRLNEYFAEEAADYLQQLDTILSAPVPPDPIRLLRLTTGVRGSTQMAGADEIAELAGRFETTARAILTGSVEWTEEIRSLALRTVKEIQSLVHVGNGWGAEETDRIQAVASMWNDLRSGAASPAAGEVEIVPIETLYFDDPGPHVLAEPGTPAPAPEMAVVSIEELLLRGHDALRAAIVLRPEFEEIARGDAMPPRPLADLVDELFALIELGLTSEPSEA